MLRASAPRMALQLPRLRAFFPRHDVTLPREQGKFGGDPRADGIWPTDGDSGQIAAAWSLGRDGSVEELYGGIAHLRAVLHDAAQHGEPVVLKFKREGCRACQSTAKAYESLAQSYRGRCRFFVVDFDHCRSFCQQCGVRTVPCAHLWKDGHLHEAVGLGPSAWDAFIDRLAGAIDPGHVSAHATTLSSEDFFNKLAEARSLHSIFG